MNLYRKYRPSTFEDMLGNEAEISAFSQALDKPDRSHVYLLYGPAGCGKTTLARIAAAKLGADEMSISEINSANNRGIDSAREITENMVLTPMSGGNRVYIIDEVARATADFQNAMLKPLEDTPAHVFFFLCTTDPQKLIKPLLTRCTQIRVNPLDPEVLYKYLRVIANREKATHVPKDIIKEISENCNGSPRMALVMLEKVIAMSDESKMLDAVSLGTLEEETITLCRALINAKPDWRQIGVTLAGLSAAEPEKIRQAVIGYMNAVLLKNNNPNAAIVLECFAEPFFNSGHAGITLAAYQAVFSKER
jgi:DNA polymerase-3 subunit gamma/tau